MTGLDFQIEEENVNAKSGAGGTALNARHVDGARSEFTQYVIETSRTGAVDLADDSRPPAVAVREVVAAGKSGCSL